MRGTATVVAVVVTAIGQGGKSGVGNDGKECGHNEAVDAGC